MIRALVTCAVRALNWATMVAICEATVRRLKSPGISAAVGGAMSLHSPVGGAMSLHSLPPFSRIINSTFSPAGGAMTLHSLPPSSSLSIAKSALKVASGSAVGGAIMIRHSLPPFIVVSDDRGRKQMIDKCPTVVSRKWPNIPHCPIMCFRRHTSRLGVSTCSALRKTNAAQFICNSPQEQSP